MAPAHLSYSRAIPVSVDDAFARTLPAPLPSIFRRWYGPIAPVKSTSETEVWGQVGQTRTVTQVGGGTMLETLVAVDSPSSFAYELTQITGALTPIIAKIDGRWSFAPAGTGTLVTWEWDVHPASRIGALAVPIIGRLWRGYARQGFEDLSDLLLQQE